MDKGIWVEEIKEYVKDDEEYSEYASEIMDEYCDELAKEEGMTRPTTEDDPEEYSEMWTTKASRLIEREIQHYYVIGIKHWPDGDIEIKPMQYREY